MTKPTEETLKTKEFQSKLKSIIQNGDMSELTASEIRSQLEDYFGYDRGSLKAKPYKKLINQWIDQVIQEGPTQQEETVGPSKEQEEEVIKEPFPEPSPEPSPEPAPRKRKAPAIDESSDNDDEFQQESISNKKQKMDSKKKLSVPKKMAKKAAVSSESEEELEVKKKPSKKSIKRQPVSDEDENMTSASEQEEDEPATSPPPVKKKTPSFKTKTTRAVGSDKDEETIKRLKQFIGKCGVRKVWARELADCATAAAEIKKLKAILEELGMKGRPSLDKCDAIKKERELKAELDSLDTSLILDTDTKIGRSTRLRNKPQSRTSYVVSDDDDSSEEEEEEQEQEQEQEQEEENKDKPKRSEDGSSNDDDDDEEEASDKEEEENDDSESSGDDFQGDESDDE